MKEMDDIFYHKCALDVQEDIILTTYPGDTRREQFYRLVTRYITISLTNPRARRMFKSMHSMEKERRRHVKSYPLTIHPFSSFRLHWEVLMIIIYTYAILSITTNTVFVYTSTQRTKIENILYVRADMFHCLFCCMDIIVNSFSGYVDRKTKRVVLVRGKIISNYIQTYFIFDIVSSIPLDYLFPWLGFDCIYCDWLAVARMVKYVRLYSVELYVFRFCEVVKMSHIVCELLWCVCRFFIFAYLLTCIHYVVGWEQVGREVNAWVQTNDIGDNFILPSLYRAICNMFNVGVGLYYPETLPDQFLTIAGAIIGIFFAVLFIGKILQLVFIMNASKSKYDQLIGNLKEYMRYKQLPHNLQKRLVDFYEFRFQKSFFKENEILKVLSIQLRQEIILHTCRRLVENVSFFNNLPAGLLLRIIVCLRSDVFLANDVILKVGTLGDCMFFITSGTVAVYTSTGKEVVHLEDGAHFGEIALVMQQRRVASVVAIESCEMYRLDRKDFVRAIWPFPDLVARIQRVAEERYERTMQMEERSRQSIRLLPDHAMSLRTAAAKFLSADRRKSSIKDPTILVERPQLVSVSE